MKEPHGVQVNRYKNMENELVYLLNGERVILKERLSDAKFLVEKIVICEDYDTGIEDTRNSGVEIVVNAIYKKIPFAALDYDIKKRKEEIDKLNTTIKERENAINSMGETIQSMLKLMKSVFKSAEEIEDISTKFNKSYSDLIQKFRYT